jgi:glutathione S-transferase
MEIELISFKLCPFAQRASISLTQQNIDFKTTYVNLMNPPDWFNKISPTGQVPLLRVDGQIIFESNVIGEFINDISEQNLHPKNPIKKANNRAWIEFSSALFGNLFKVITGDEATFNASKTDLFSQLEKIETANQCTPFFNGSDVNLIDIAFAPFFMRLNWINKFTNQTLSLNQFPKIKAWSEALLALEVVKNSVAEELDDVYYSNIEAREGYLSTQLID